MEKYYNDKEIEEVLSFFLPLETVHSIIVYIGWDKKIPKHQLYIVYQPWYRPKFLVITPSDRKKGVRWGWLRFDSCSICGEKTSIFFSFQNCDGTIHNKRIVNISVCEHGKCKSCCNVLKK